MTQDGQGGTTSSGQTQDQNSPATTDADAGAKASADAAGEVQAKADGKAKSDGVADGAADKSGGDKVGADKSKDDGSDGKVKDKDAAPDVTITYPQSLGEVSSELDAEIKAFVKDNGLGQEQADAGVKLFAKAFETAAARQTATHTTTIAEWEDGLKDEFGKSFDERAGRVEAFFRTYGGDELVEEMKQVGGHRMPSLFKAIDRAASKLVSGGGRTSAATDPASGGRGTLVNYNHPDSQKAAERLANRT